MGERVSAEVVEARRRWVEALESGRWTQTHMALRGTGQRERCCLGVGCSVSKLGRWNDEYEYVVDGKGEDGTMPAPVAALYGVPTGPQFGYQGELASRNDGDQRAPGSDPADEDYRPWTFPEIAALLRSDAWFGPDLDRVVA